MTDRRHIRDQLSAYLDGELPAEAAEAVRRAIEADHVLADQYRQIRAVAELVRLLPRVSAPDWIAARLRAAARRRAGRLSRRPAPVVSLPSRLLSAAATALLAASIGVIVAGAIWGPAPTQAPGPTVAARHEAPAPLLPAPAPRIRTAGPPLLVSADLACVDLLTDEPDKAEREVSRLLLKKGLVPLPLSSDFLHAGLGDRLGGYDPRAFGHPQLGTDQERVVIVLVERTQVPALQAELAGLLLKREAIRGLYQVAQIRRMPSGSPRPAAPAAGTAATKGAPEGKADELTVWVEALADAAKECLPPPSDNGHAIGETMPMLIVLRRPTSAPTSLPAPTRRTAK